METDLWYTVASKITSCSLFVPLHVPHCPLACSLLYPSNLSFTPLCVPFCTRANSFSNFSVLIFTVFFPSCAFPLPVVLVAFLSYLFPSCHSLFLPIVLFPLCHSFIPGLCRTFFFSQSYTFLLNVSRGFRIKYAKFKGHNKPLKRKLKRKKKGKIYELNMGNELRAFWSRSGRRAIALPRHGTVNLCKKRFV